MLLARTISVLALAASICFCQARRPPFQRHPNPKPDPVMLTSSDVAAVVEAAASSVNSEAMVISVTDRQGDILAIYDKPAEPATSAANFGIQADTKEVAVALARTASFFSNDQAPLSSRTVRFISGIHFPPGIAFTSNAPLYGIENSNRGCPFNAEYIKGQEFPPARSIDGVQPGLGILTGKANLTDSDPNAVNPGGVPLFKQGVMVGGVGVAGVPPDVAEFAALSGAVGAGFGANPAPPGVVMIGGIALPFVNQTTRPAGYAAGSADGKFLLGPMNSPQPPPEGDLVAPRAGPLGGLTQTDVQGIINAAVAEANLTRAVIRLPIGSRARMVIAVSDLDGTIAQCDLLQRTESRSQRFARCSDGNCRYEPDYRLRWSTDLSARHRRHRARPVFAALSIRHAEPMHPGLANRESESKWHCLFPWVFAVIQKRCPGGRAGC
jgi:hypothetical protein